MNSQNFVINFFNKWTFSSFCLNGSLSLAQNSIDSSLEIIAILLQSGEVEVEVLEAEAQQLGHVGSEGLRDAIESVDVLALLGGGL